MPRRKKRRSRRKKNFNLNLVETAGGLILADQMLGPAGAGQIMKGDVAGALGTLAGRLRSKTVQEDLVKTGLGIVLVKSFAKSLHAGNIGSIGPLKFKV